MKQLMKSMEANPMRLLAGACSLVLSLGAAHATLAQQTAKAPAQAQPVAAASSLDALAPVSFSALLPGTTTAQAAAKPVAEEEEESLKPHKAGHEGVKVHGHWLLQVKNADGTLGERREFENSLTSTTAGGFVPSGAQALAAMLSGKMTVGPPAIGLVQGALTGDPASYCLADGTYGNNGQTCYVFADVNSWFSGPAQVPTIFAGLETGLTESVTFTPNASIVLSGVYTVPAGLTSIAAVESLYFGCVSASFRASNVSNLDALSGNSSSFSTADIAPSACNFTTINAGTTDNSNILIPLTYTAVPGGPMGVTLGQVIQVSVTLSFS